MGLRYITPSIPPYIDKRSLSLSAGSTQYADLGFGLVSNGANTISAWFKLTAGNSLDMDILSQEFRNGLDVVTSSTFSIELVTDGGGVGTIYGYYWSNASSVIYLGRQCAFTAGTWVHVVLTYDGSSVATMYINGATTGTSAFASGVWTGLNLNAKNIWVGAQQRSTTPNKLYTGLVDSVLIFQGTAITSGNVTSLYNSGKVGNPAALSFYSSASHYYPIGEYGDTTSLLYDRKGGSNATTSGSPTFSTTIP